MSVEPGSAVDQELKKAFQELQGKMVETKRKLRVGDYQTEYNKAEIKKAELTKLELQALPQDTPTYQSIGRMFLKQSLNDSIALIDERMKASEEKMATVQNQKVYLEKSLKEAEANIREMVQARQAAAR